MRFDPNTSLLAGLDTPTLQGMLSDAQVALAALNTGQREVRVAITGGGQHREVVFASTDEAALINWIRLLQAQLGIISAPRQRARIRYS